MQIAENDWRVKVWHEWEESEKAFFRKKEHRWSQKSKTIPYQKIEYRSGWCAGTVVNVEPMKTSSDLMLSVELDMGGIVYVPAGMTIIIKKRTMTRREREQLARETRWAKSETIRLIIDVTQRNALFGIKEVKFVYRRTHVQ